MIKESASLPTTVFEKRFGGKGSVQVKTLLSLEGFRGKGRLFAKNIIPPGSSIGFHKHEKDFETYYILSGEGIVDDNGAAKPVKAGDVVYTAPGETHSIENTGSQDLEMIALILFV